MPAMMGQTRNPGHLATAHLGRRFAYLAIEFGCLLDDQNACFGPFALSMSAVAAPEKAAADEHGVVIEVGRSKKMDFTLS
jgi:hypothetical protein